MQYKKQCKNNLIYRFTTTNVFKEQTNFKELVKYNLNSNNKFKLLKRFKNNKYIPYDFLKPYRKW